MRVVAGAEADMLACTNTSAECSTPDSVSMTATLWLRAISSRRLCPWLTSARQ